MDLDETDLLILELLKQDGRMPVAQLAQHVKLSRVATNDRLNKLKKKGVIKGFIPLVDNVSLGYSCSAFLDIEVEPQHIEDIANTLAELPEVIVVYLMTGGVNLHAHALLKDNHHLSQFLHANIYPIEGIRNVHTSIMLKRYKTDLTML